MCSKEKYEVGRKGERKMEAVLVRMRGYDPGTLLTSYFTTIALFLSLLTCLVSCVVSVKPWWRWLPLPLVLSYYLVVIQCRQFSSPTVLPVTVLVIPLAVAGTMRQPVRSMLITTQVSHRHLVKWGTTRVVVVIQMSLGRVVVVPERVVVVVLRPVVAGGRFPSRPGFARRRPRATSPS
uniref:Uncharacterized protein n=1 Tax=Cacopsylla melanoneura TaxID=428564 RepID=A0A8D8WQ19_9HEMI